ncbi:hypothetical protein Corgl_1103 [Coriobacterium glomerans PW2]|uniref:Uncharacterized protein n=1 Tax=Coriobacterium glomerans (strain ATCC 49209 / DSM 20642 / JCM 10262 / PW2) TaxID=700015 RepID=F2N827_CORGP|nr:hypothetical protein Corgl_1103 [Coriobacterium glomerans PW2]
MGSRFLRIQDMLGLKNSVDVRACAPDGRSELLCAVFL